MARIGLNVDGSGRHDATFLTERHATCARIVLQKAYDLRGLFANYVHAGIDILGVYARESEGGFASRSDALTYYANMYASMLRGIQAGNEPDGAWNPGNSAADNSVVSRGKRAPSSWVMTQEDVVVLGHAVRAAFPQTLVFSPGFASGFPEWFDGFDSSWWDITAFHPYLKDAPNPNDLEDLEDVTGLFDGYARYGKPRACTEWGWWGTDESRGADEIHDMVAWAAASTTLTAYFHFCADDQMVPPFGLVAADGKNKLGDSAFRGESVHAVNVPWPVVSVTGPVVPTVDLHVYARTAATRNRVDPDIFEKQIQQESKFNPNAYNEDSGASGIAQIVVSAHPGVNVWDPYASLDYAAAWVRTLLDANQGSYVYALASYNWGPGNVAHWDGKRSTLPLETQKYLDIILGPNWGTVIVAPTLYNRDMATILQDKDWDCSEESLRWCFWAWGRTTADAWLEGAMIAQDIATPDVGLHDASGAGLARFIRENYGELGYDSTYTNPVTFDALAAEFVAPSNPYPGCIGGRTWGNAGHWAAIRDYDPVRDVLRLANPAPGHPRGNPLAVQDTMSRRQFDAFGPFSLVRVMHPGSSVVDPPPPPEPTPERPAQRRAMHAQIRVLADALDQIAD